MKTISIYDTTLRDGTQAEGVSLSLLDKIHIAQRLAEIGIDLIEGGFPYSNPKDQEFFQRMRGTPLHGARLCAFGMTRRRGVVASEDPGLRALVAAETPCITVVGKSWDYHATDVLGVSLEENLAMIGESVEYLARHAEVVYDAEHFFDGYRANAEHALAAIRAAAEAGASWIVLCDTNGGSLPERVAEVVQAARTHLVGLPVRFGIHCHNDGDLATANSLAAIDAGCEQVQGTINGIGERCGNADLIAVVANLAFKKAGYQVLGGKPLDHWTELSRFVYETANLQLRNNQPFVGQSAFAHKGGMHVHAVNKAAHTYEHLDPAKVGNERRILVSELSGRSNILAATKQFTLEPKQVEQVLQEVVEREHEGYQYEAAEASFDLLVRRTLGWFQPHFETIKYRIVAGDRNATLHHVFAEAILKIRVGDEIKFEAAEGHGPVNAMDAVLRKALADHYQPLQGMHLVDYKVRVVDGKEGTAAKIRVNIECADAQGSWRTIGVSENIIEASWLAMTDAVEYILHRETIPPAACQTS